MSDATATPSRRARGGGGAARRAERTAVSVETAKYIERNIPNYEVLDDAALEIIEQNAETVLAEIGVMFVDNPEALERWRKAGAEVDGERVRIPRGLARKLCATAPSQFTQHARNPERNVEIGGRNLVLAPVYGPPFVRDAEGGRRYATMADFEKFVKLGYMSKWLHHSGGTVCEPTDIPVNKRHLDMLLAHMTLSDKPFMGSVTEPSRAQDSVDMCGILFGDDFMETHPVTTGNCNGNSPLVWDETMLGAMRAFARYNQPVLCSPFVLGGANTPASVAPTVAQLNAEALSALAYTQVVNKGTPAIYGHYLATVSMKSGAPMAGTPEISLMNMMIGQMARFYDVPWRTSNTLGGSKTFDAQAGYESATTLMAVLMSGANYIWHSAGWNEAGMHCSMAKFVVDAEQCAMGYRMAQGVNWDDFDAAIQAVRDVGPGGHYLGHPHTLENFQQAFFMPELFDNNSVEQWQADGSVEINERALGRVRTLLGEYEEPKLDVAVNDELLDYIARREREIPVADALNQDH